MLPIPFLNDIRGDVGNLEIRPDNALTTTWGKSSQNRFERGTRNLKVEPEIH